MNNLLSPPHPIRIMGIKHKVVLFLILIIIFVFLTSLCFVQAVEVTATISISASGPIAYDSGRGEIWVAYYVPFVTELGMHVSKSNSVAVISDVDNSVVKTVTVGDGPDGIVYDSGKNEIFVANSGSITVSVISDITNAVVATVDLRDPNYDGNQGLSGLVYDSGKGEVFVVDYFTGNISVISDITNKVVATIPLGNDIGISDLAYISGKGEIWVTHYQNGKSNNSSNFITVISDSTNEVVATVPLSSNGYRMAYDWGRSEIFVVTTTFNSCLPSERLGRVILPLKFFNSELLMASKR